MAIKLEYELSQHIEYYSKRYNRTISVPIGRESDGATGAKDLEGPIKCLKDGEPFEASESWWVHDEGCITGKWDDGTPLTNWQLSWVLRDILKSEGHGFRKCTWLFMTFLFGGGKARKNSL